MDVTFGWILAIGGLGLGFGLALVPGMPGAVIALLGVASLAALSDWTVVTPEALLLATVLAAISGVVQAMAPAWGIRSVSTATGAATGAVVFGALGLLAPIPLVPMLLAAIGAVLGGIVGGGSFLSRLWVPLGVVPALGIAVLADVVAVCAIGGVLGLGSFLAG